MNVLIMKRGERRARILAVLVIAAVAACFTLVPVEAHADNPFTLGSTAYTVASAADPELKISYNVSQAGMVYLDEFKDGLWVKIMHDTPSSGSGTIDVFGYPFAEYFNDPHPAGTFKYRLRQGDNIGSPTAVSPDFTITYNKTKPQLDIGTTKHTGEFYTTSNPSSSSDIYYLLKDKSVNLTWISGKYEYGTVHIQRLDGSKWVNVDTFQRVQSNTATDTYKIYRIYQYTSGTKSYRLYCPATEYTSEATSAVFTITGKKQSPGLSVKYSKKSQKRGSSSRVRLTVLTKFAYSGKAVVYDGSKKLKTLTIKYGYIKGKYAYSSYYYLPKTLKKGTHKISVKFTATGVIKPFYKTQTSKVTKIKVK
jgi:hypothetical protein